MSVLPMPAKIALITAGAAALFALRFVVAHAFTVMVLVAVISAIFALVSSRKRSTGDNITSSESDSDHVHALGQATHYGLPQAQAQQQSAAWSIADAVRHH